MLNFDQLFNSVLWVDTGTHFSIELFLLCTLGSLVLGALIAAFYSFRNRYSKGFLLALALLPAIVQMVIMLVNGNIGTGIAVMGAFSLIRFRSVAGSAREICSIFLAMAVGLATGMGYLAIAAVFVLIIGGVNMLYSLWNFGEPDRNQRQLKITIPEDLDYSGVFDDLFQRYTSQHELEQVKTSNMGSLYKLDYQITLKDPSEEKNFLDALRCRNGNLDIICGKVAYNKEGL